MPEENKHSPEESKHSEEIEISYGIEETNETKRFFCPITHELFEDPVIASDGKNYERQAIEQWINQAQAQQKTPSSPCTNLPLISTILYPNIDLKQEIENAKPASIWKAIFELEETQLLEQIQDHPDPYDPIPDPDKRTALIYAVLKKRRSVIEYLLQDKDEKGLLKATRTYVNLEDSSGRTALMLACCEKEIQLETIQCLLANGVDPTIQSKKYKRTALMYAVRAKHHAVVSYLLGIDENGRPRAPKEYVNSRDSTGFTALLVACLQKDTKLETIQCLLANGADPKLIILSKEDGLISALSLANKMQREDIKKCLLEHATQLQHAQQLRQRQQPQFPSTFPQRPPQSLRQQRAQPVPHQPFVQEFKFPSNLRTNTSFPNTNLNGSFLNDSLTEETIERQQSLLSANQHNPRLHFSSTNSSSGPYQQNVTSSLSRFDTSSNFSPTVASAQSVYPRHRASQRYRSDPPSHSPGLVIFNEIANPCKLNALSLHFFRLLNNFWELLYSSSLDKLNKEEMTAALKEILKPGGIFYYAQGCLTEEYNQFSFYSEESEDFQPKFGPGTMFMNKQHSNTMLACSTIVPDRSDNKPKRNRIADIAQLRENLGLIGANASTSSPADTSPPRRTPAPAPASSASCSSFSRASTPSSFASYSSFSSSSAFSSSASCSSFSRASTPSSFASYSSFSGFSAPSSSASCSSFSRTSMPSSFASCSSFNSASSVPASSGNSASNGNFGSSSSSLPPRSTSNSVFGRISPVSLLKSQREDVRKIAKDISRGEPNSSIIAALKKSPLLPSDLNIFLFFAISYKSDLSLVEFLLTKMSLEEINSINSLGQSPLTFACEQQEGPEIISIIDCLLENGADATVKNAKMETAIEIARKYGCVEISKLFSQQESMSHFLKEGNNAEETDEANEENEGDEDDEVHEVVDVEESDEVENTNSVSSAPIAPKIPRGGKRNWQDVQEAEDVDKSEESESDEIEDITPSMARQNGVKHSRHEVGESKELVIPRSNVGVLSTFGSLGSQNIQNDSNSVSTSSASSFRFFSAPPAAPVTHTATSAHNNQVSNT